MGKISNKPDDHWLGHGFPQLGRTIPSYNRMSQTTNFRRKSMGLRYEVTLRFQCKNKEVGAYDILNKCDIYL